MKISVIGAGYVGLSIASLLAQDNDVVVVDIQKEKVDKINNHVSPFKDGLISEFLSSGKLHLQATTDYANIRNSDYIIISVPTNYDTRTARLDTSIVETAVNEALRRSPDSIIVIKSTVGIGFTDSVAAKYPDTTIIFSPEFLREGKALHDNLYPSRIISGSKDKTAAEKFGDLLAKHALITTPVIVTSPSSAESIKLFSNTYLALRVAFFNELDTFAAEKKLNAKEIIRGVSADPRIGDYYNNPSFGFGGYCLPKDTKQILANYNLIPQNIISAICVSNTTRKQYIADAIIAKGKSPVGIYLLSMKAGSDNIRESAILDIINLIKKKHEVILYDPMIKDKTFLDCTVEPNFDTFVEKCQIILANRVDDNVERFRDKLYTRDITGGDD